MRSVKFRMPHGIYNKGETAGFPDTEAQRLVDRKLADFTDTTDAKKAKPSRKKDDGTDGSVVTDPAATAGADGQQPDLGLDGAQPAPVSPPAT